MSDYLQVHVGEDWIDYFNVQDCDYLLFSKYVYLVVEEYEDEE